MRTSVYFIIVVTVVMSLGGTASADFDPNELVNSMHEFLIRQMEVFDSIRPLDQPPLVQTYGWVPNLPFPPSELNPPPCCNPPCAPVPMWPEPWKLIYRGDTYDQSLTAIWFTQQAWLDLLRGRNCTENLTRAQRLIDTVILLEEHDPYADGRIRTAYWANSPLTGDEASIMDPSVGVGNMAWFGIALTRFCWVAEKTGCLDAPTVEYYLEKAKDKANWILRHCKSSICVGGFTGGYEGWGQNPITWKSTEHNIDVYVFAQNLYALDCNPKWAEMAEHAAHFVQQMYVEVDGQCGYYLGGTGYDGCTPNPDPIPADAQTWTALARCGHIKIDTDERAEHAMQWVCENLKDRCECIILPCDGIKFSNRGKNFQSEVTAGTAMASCHMDMNTSCCGDANPLLGCLDWVRRNAAPPYDGIEDGNGIVATPCSEGAYTGYGDAWYYKLHHVASSAWTGLAAMVSQSEVTANPLMPLGCRSITTAVDIRPQSCPNPLNLKSKGLLPVAILGSEDFDVSTIDAASIELAGVQPVRSNYEDVTAPVSNGNECECATKDADGYIDLTLKFKTHEIVEELLNAGGELIHGQVLVLSLTGLLSDGTPIEGSDCVGLVGQVP